MFTITITFEDLATGLFDYSTATAANRHDAVNTATDYALSVDVAEVLVDSPDGERFLTYVRPS